MTRLVKTAIPIKIKILKFSSEKSWYKDFIEKEFIVESENTRDYYVIHNDVLRCVLKVDATYSN